MAEFSILYEDTPENVQKFLNAASKIEPLRDNNKRGFFKKKRHSPGRVELWYRVPSGENAPNDLVTAIKRRAGLIKPVERKSKPKTRKTDASTAESETTP
jgi:hypothetical protein